MVLIPGCIYGVPVPGEDCKAVMRMIATEVETGCFIPVHSSLNAFPLAIRITVFRKSLGFFYRRPRSTYSTPQPSPTPTLISLSRPVPSETMAPRPPPFRRPPGRNGKNSESPLKLGSGRWSLGLVFQAGENALLIT